MLGQIHGRLTGTGHGARAALGQQVFLLQAEVLGHGLLDIVHGDPLVPAAQVRAQDGRGVLEAQLGKALARAGLSIADIDLYEVNEAFAAVLPKQAYVDTMKRNATGLGKALAAGAGWTGGQWDALYQLWQHESGWNNNAQNPAMLWVQDGEQLWRTPTGTSGKRCADCHGDAPRSMAGVAARYPAWDATAGSALNLAGRINACRARHQQAAPLAVEHADLLSLTAYLGLQSRGQPLAPPDPDTGTTREAASCLKTKQQTW